MTNMLAFDVLLLEVGDMVPIDNPAESKSGGSSSEEKKAIVD